MNEAYHNITNISICIYIIARVYYNEYRIIFHYYYHVTVPSGASGGGKHIKNV